MNTKIIMSLSAVVMGIGGIVLTFMPNEIARALNSSVNMSFTIVLQILGAVYFAFAMLNWTAKANLIGGIYARPIAIGNLTHFTIGSLALIKAYLPSGQSWILPIAIIYAVFAVLFTIIFFTHPIRTNSN